MKETDINKRVYGFSILVAILVGVFIAVSRFTDDLYTSLWVFIPLAVVLSIVGWVIMRPVRKEFKKDAATKEKMKSSLHHLPKGMMKTYLVLGYLLGISWSILGLLLFGIVLFTHLSDSVILGGVGVAFLIMGIIALFATKSLSKGKSWGWAVLFITLLIFLLFIVSMPFFL